MKASKPSLVNLTFRTTMANLRMSINLDNAMFEDNEAPEISRIFKDLSDYSKDAIINEDSMPIEKPLRDSNGNTVGQLIIEDKDV